MTKPVRYSVLGMAGSRVTVMADAQTFEMEAHRHR